jgi:hypothetical protein
MCNLYSITTNQEAIRALFRVVNRYVGNLAPMLGVFPVGSRRQRAQTIRPNFDRSAVGPLSHLAQEQVIMALRRWSVNAAFPTQQPLWLHVKRMTQFYEFVRIKVRAPALPLHDLSLTVTRQCGELSAIHVGPSHRARQALADPLLFGDVILLEHRRTSLVSIQPTPKPRTFHTQFARPCEDPIDGPPRVGS